MTIIAKAIGHDPRGTDRCDAAGSCGYLRVFDARVEPPVQQVGRQIEEHEHHRHGEHRTLHHGIVGLRIESTIKRPIPGQENTVSTTMAPPSSTPMRTPMTMTVAGRALRIMCRSTCQKDKPRAQSAST